MSPPFAKYVYPADHPDPSLARPLIPSLIKGVLLSLGVVAGMFFFTYLPQVAVLAFVSGPLAFVAAIPLVLGEAYFVVNFLTKGFLMGQIGVDLFDAVSAGLQCSLKYIMQDANVIQVLLQKGCTELVERGRQVTSTGGTSRQLGRMLTKPLGKFSTVSRPSRLSYCRHRVRKRKLN